MLPLAMGAVVVGVPTTFQTPLSGQDCPVRAVVPRGDRVPVDMVILSITGAAWTHPDRNGGLVTAPGYLGSLEVVEAIVTSLRSGRAPVCDDRGTLAYRVR